MGTWSENVTERKEKKKPGRIKVGQPACPDLPLESTFKELFHDKRPLITDPDRQPEGINHQTGKGLIIWLKDIDHA